MSLGRIVFLTYLSRSGSTYLARLLDTYAEIGVTPEANIPDGICHRGKPSVFRDMFGGRDLALESRQDLDVYLDELWEDNKFAHWGVDRQEVKEILSEKMFPIHFSDILPTLFNIYFKRDGTSIHIYKESNYIFHLRELRELFPSCKFLFLLRDLRAMYSSQRRTCDTKRKVPMAYSPLKAARTYNRVSDILRENEGANDLLVVTYENLIRRQRLEMNRILSFLEVKCSQSGTDRYWQKIPQEQRDMHVNIQCQALKERIDGWKTELSDYETYLLQKKAGRSLTRHGYTLVDTPDVKISDRLWLAYYLMKSLQNKKYWYGLWLRTVFKTGPKYMV